MRSAVDVCIRTLTWSERQDYSGYDKFDALNSPVLRAIAGNSKLLRSGFIYLISRAPLNLRPLLGVQKRQNPKSLGIFARACFHLHRLTSDEAWVAKGLRLLERLVELSRVQDFSGHCWGAQHPRGDPALGVAANFPGAVVTCEIAEAFLDAFEERRDERHLDVARSAARFITDDLEVLEEGDAGLCVSYVPGHKSKVVNSNAKTAALLARVGSITQEESLRTRARANMAWVMGKQTEAGAWFYADPPESSHVKHDNYHTGFVLSSIHAYTRATGDESWASAYARGLEFYERCLFLPSGAPKWRHDRVYPLDIKGASQGILNFSLASDALPGKLDVARRIARWAIENMWLPEGRFLYQKGRFLTKKLTFMRWCQCWSCYALSVLADAELRREGRDR
jgi:hypothetical protein